MIYFYVLLLRIVAYLEGPAKIISFALVFTLISYSTLKRVKSIKKNKATKFIFYVSALVFLVLIHGSLYGNILIRDVAVMLTYWIWAVFAYIYFKDKTTKEALRFILISFLIFNVANYIYFKLYFSDQKLGLNSILGLFGIYDYRIFFPLSSGANVFTSQLGLNAIISLYFIKQNKRKFLYFSIFTFYLYMLVLADSRLIILLTLLFSTIYWFSLRQILLFFKKTWWIFGLIIIGLLYIFYNTAFFDGFKRAGEIEGRSISRIEIWTIAIQVVFDGVNAVFGHGLNGFENNLPDAAKEAYESQRLQTSHNFIIQCLIDFGLFGLSIILLIMHNILLLTLKLKEPVIMVLIIMLLLIGITESIPSFYTIEPTLFFIAILSIIITQNERKNIRFN
ncbi:O-antigen ligase family protein [Ichthyenterobacterium sp. W332]|uniref:O-antigen ligase family protein n=1 Tax=Microcosmobacter mediterraneus TaxID=3075607 RepID=A0ABU2YIQ7_9FLAO|nr:O-antigen ligase family protein [Ichthyenterobacterium sp. W332]MDT0558063.1 O-antigen ligase family protein [Ichthyenterobacterium sp. W332]